MKTIIIDGFTFTYDIERNEKFPNVHLRVKNKEYIIASVNSLVSVYEIEEVLQKRINFIIERLPKQNVDNIIHIKGIPYKPTFLLSDKPYVKIIGDMVLIAAPNREAKTYKKVLYDYYEKIIYEELCKIINDAMYDFRDIKFPSITIKYYKGRFACYDTRDNKIFLSSILGKHELEHIKLTLYHELCHVYVYDHSKKFYDIFESKYPNARKIDLASRKVYFRDCL